MKIVTYDEFIRLPSGSVFCPYTPCYFHSPFQIKVDKGKEYQYGYIFNGTMPLEPWFVDQDNLPTETGTYKTEMAIWDDSSVDFEKDGLSMKAVTFRFEDNVAYLDFELNKKAEHAAPAFAFDPFSPAGRTIPKGNEHLICHDDDPADAVTQTLAVGMDGKVRTSRLTRYNFTASGTFTSPSTFDINVRNTEMIESVNIRATFFRGMLNLEAVGSIPENSVLTIRDISGVHFSSQS